jgi:hypothetical protein
MRLIDADAAAEKLMQEAMKHATDINGGLAVQLILMLAKCLRDPTDFPTIYPHEVMQGGASPRKIGSKANGCWITCNECANTSCPNRDEKEGKSDGTG